MSDALSFLLRVAGILSLFITGAVLLVAGFVYDVLFAGIPYQDPTPELASQYEFHAHIARRFYLVGGISWGIGLVAIPFLWHFTKPRTTPQAHQIR